MSDVPENLRYSAEHEWVSESDGVLTVGITAHAVKELGDIVYLELPDVGAEVTAGAVCGEIESTKAVSEIYSPLSGEVLEVNAALDDNPEAVNDEPYGSGWLYKMRASAETELLDAAAYSALIA